MKTIKIIVLGLVVVSSLQSCSGWECLIIPGCKVEDENKNIDINPNEKDLYASISDSTNFNS